MVAGGNIKDPTQAAGPQHVVARVPHFSETWKELLEEKQEQENNPPRDTAALLHSALIVPHTKETVSPKIPGGFSFAPETSPDERLNIQMKPSAAGKLDGVKAPTTPAPLNVAPASGEGTVRKPQIPSLTPAALAGLPVPTASDVQRSTETVIAASTLPAGSSHAAPRPRIEETKPAAAGEAAVAPAPVQTLGGAPTLQAPSGKAAQPVTERNRPKGQTTAGDWASPKPVSANRPPEDFKGEVVFEPARPRDSADMPKPTPTPAPALESNMASSLAAAPGSAQDGPEMTAPAIPAAPPDTLAQPSILAFAARLAPLFEPEAALAKPASPTTTRSPVQALQPLSAGGISPTDQAQAQEPDRSTPVSHVAHSELRTAPKSVEPERTPPGQDSVPAPASSHSDTPASPNASLLAATTTTPGNSPQRPQPLTPDGPAPQAARTQIESPLESAKAATPVREIEIQVNRGDQRVDVRLTERSGEVLVAVRTPDTQLAGTLREDLPLLSSRLEQAGFRADAWHPGASAPENRMRAAESQSSNTSSQDSNPSRQGGQEQQQPSPRQPKPPAAKATTNTPRKDFAWLMSKVS
jgi:hypothetical protein